MDTYAPILLEKLNVRIRCQIVLEYGVKFADEGGDCNLTDL